MKDEEKKGIYYVLLALIGSVLLMAYSIKENNGLLIVSGAVTIFFGCSVLIWGMMQRYQEKREEQK